jgi:tRNA uridine 5-carboxymethylaminomethyl modification enzyme
MSCNPAIGGTAKGHLVREIDALGGEMGKLADRTGIHFRMLNKSKGPAVWSPRSQNDREWYACEAKQAVFDQPGLEVIEDTLLDLCLDGMRITGILTAGRGPIPCEAVVLCGGTFLNAVMHTGMSCTPGGRFSESACNGLSDSFVRLGFVRGRLKTGTPPRLRRDTIDFGLAEEQQADSRPVPFSFQNKKIHNTQIPMYLTYTNQRTHDILRSGFDQSPMFTGKIAGVGPRYCPSIEDKICRFAERERHQLFLEPEGYESEVVYLNGFSTSLPSEIQEEAVRTVSGLENCEILRYGYAVEYDFFPPHQLKSSLETKLVKGLFFAGQINGTSGYEEAAAQGIMAGINAAMAVEGREPVVLDRSEAYIGVLIDDLINKSTEEPYRIFTSRAEYRLKLRQDNADSRLMRIGYKVGLVRRGIVDQLDRKEEQVEQCKGTLERVFLAPNEVNRFLTASNSCTVNEPISATQLLRRPELTVHGVMEFVVPTLACEIQPIFADPEILERVQIEVRYEGYLKRQDEQISQFRKNESLSIPEGFDFTKVKSLSTEGREKLARIRPSSIGQATRISGVTPADVAVLMINLRD